MNTSQNGINLIKQFEGCYLQSYLCPASVWTVGYGHVKNVVKGMNITQVQAEMLLKDDLKIYEQAINDENLIISQNQFDALVSFAFNVGTGAFRSSTLLKKIKADAKDLSIRTDFLKWIYSGKKVLQGLVSRRAAEANLYFK